MAERGDQDRIAANLADWERELPEAVGADTELAKRLLLVGESLREAMRQAAARHGLTLAEHNVLAGLRRRGARSELTPTQLAEESLLSSGGASNVLRRLDERGLIERSGRAEDGRRRPVRLTAEGAALAEAAVIASAEAQSALLQGLEAEQKDRLLESLRRIPIRP